MLGLEFHSFYNKATGVRQRKKNDFFFQVEAFPGVDLSAERFIILIEGKKA
jgi:hypothetical protein